MRPLLLIALVALLVGLLLAEATIAEEQVKCDGLYNDKKVPPEKLASVLEKHKRWVNKVPNGQRANLCGADLQKAALEKANLAEANLQEANLAEANLQGAVLREANLQEAVLSRANLQKANLFLTNLQAVLDGANLQGAYLSRANLQGADLPGAKLQGAVLREAKLQGAVLREANLQGTDLSLVDLHASTFEPVSLPDIRSIASAQGLSTLQFTTSPQALQELREAFKKAGYRRQEREITHALWRSQRVLDWEGTLFQKAESLFKLVLFEWPCAYGMDPWRPFQWLTLLIPVFTCVYVGALRTANRHTGIWVSYSADRSYKRRQRTGKTLMHQGLWVASGAAQKDKRRETKREWRTLLTHWPPAKTQNARRKGGDQPIILSLLGLYIRGPSFWWRTWRIALYFSLLSAFHLGWKELTVGTWLTRIQRRPYTLSATGWVRTVSGVHSLLSVYLLALWALTYFGRPFE